MNTKKQTRSSLQTLGLSALILALIIRLGLAMLDRLGGITYDYIAASTGPILTQMLTVFTGAQLYGVIVASLLMCSVYCAAQAILVRSFQQDSLRSFPFLKTLMHGLFTTVIALFCAAIVGSRTLSAVQIAAMKTKLEVNAGMILMAVMMLVIFVALFTSIAAAIYTVVQKKVQGKSFFSTLILLVITWGLLTSISTAFTFNTFNQTHLNGMAIAGWLAIDTGLHMLYAILLPKILLVKKCVASSPEGSERIRAS